jgi:tetratricopeptide (TPR) repeat protein
MISLRRSYAAALITTSMFGAILLGGPAYGQDAAWEGFIQAGRAALQQQNYSEAESHFEDALEAAERFQSNDPRLGKSYNNLAAVYYAQEDYGRAEPLMRRALDQLRESLGPDNTEVAQTMKNLAALYYLQGNRTEAEGLLQQALVVMERVHGPNHAYVATVLSNLAGLYQADNRYQDAEPLLTRSLTIWESLLGPDHPDVSRSRSLLAQVREANAARLGTAQAEPAPLPAEEPEANDQDVAASGQEDVAPVAPRALTPLATAEVETDVSQRIQERDDETTQAALALERLTQASKAEVEGAAAAVLPTPALRPIDEGAESEPVTQASVGQAGGPEIAAQAEVEADRGSDIVTSALAAPSDLEPAAAAAIINEAKSSDDVTYAVYLSTLWSVDEAERYWHALLAAMPGVFDDKKMEIEEVAAADGLDSFYRVLTSPFASDPQAQELCDYIKRKLRTHDCDVVVRDQPTGG